MRPGPFRDSLSEHAPVAGGLGVGLGPSLLLVDDNPEMLRALALYFEKRGFVVTCAATMADAKESFPRRTHWTLVVSDFHLPDGNGWELCNWIREQAKPPPPFLLMSGSGMGADLCPQMDILEKPFTLPELERRVSALLRVPPAG